MLGRLPFTMLTIAGAALLAGGCSGEQGVLGGTPGVLRNSTGGVRDVQINVHRTGDYQLMGFGISKEAGAFELYLPQAAGPLHLPPGDYVVTLESVGPELIPLPREISDPRRTPLRKTWAGGDATLELLIP